MIKVFLGGTCCETIWRQKLISLIDSHVHYFNPVVEDWTPECAEEENRQKETCDYCLYVITPSMQGVYSIAEVVEDSNKRPEKTLFCVLSEELSYHAIYPLVPSYVYPSGKINFSAGEMRSLRQVVNIVANNGAKVFASLENVANFLIERGSLE
jgi:hypothetical protein